MNAFIPGAIAAVITAGYIYSGDKLNMLTEVNIVMMGCIMSDKKHK